MRRATISTAAIGVPLGVILLGTVIYPSLVLIWQGITRAGQPTLANFVAVLGEADTWQVLWNSLHVSIWATAIGGAVGTVLAFLVCRTNLPGRRFFRPALLLPYLIPPLLVPWPGWPSWVPLDS